MSSITILKSLSTIKKADWQGELKKWMEELAKTLADQDEDGFLTTFVLPPLSAVHKN